jgi:translation initiation factor IF-3
MIRIPQVRVVDEEGAQLGVMPTPRALEMAQERGLDLVEVAPMASPPVVKFLDFGQYKYELTKREKEAKRKQRSVTFKEVRLSPKIGGDFDTKVNRAIEFSRMAIGSR